MAGAALSLTPFFKSSLISSLSHNSRNPTAPFILNFGKRLLFRCSSKKKISFVDQILDYIEGTIRVVCEKNRNFYLYAICYVRMLVLDLQGVQS